MENTIDPKNEGITKLINLNETINTTPNKGINLNKDFLLEWRILLKQEKKENYRLLELGEFKDVILTHNERFEVKSNIPKRFQVSHDFNWGYKGAGPTDLALSLLLQFSNEDLEFTHNYYLDLVDEWIQYLPQNEDIILDAKMLLEWVERKRNQPPRHSTTYRPMPCEPDRIFDSNLYAALRPKVLEEMPMVQKNRKGKYVR